ncbi:MAG: phosphoenolpyruvate mutase [Gammaproteobacteria bacterium]
MSGHINSVNKPGGDKPGLSKAAQLRALLYSGQLEFILEAHNGISAKIVERTGFSGIWASGLAMSAQFGVRDSNEASWTQVVDMLEFMSDVTRIPILLDGDTGYGNFNNMRRLVRKLEQRAIAGVCIEDKQFPKTNSFIDGEKQALADVEEFCGKIKAGKDSQLDDDFCIVARVEALIAGWGMAEAIRRAEAYHAAGADAILIHSKLSRPDEIVEFARQWDQRCPVVIVPTKYYSTPTDVFRKANISLVIWANHLIRSAIESMEKVSRQIMDEQSLTNIEDQVTAVDHVFELQGADELSRAQERYLGAATATQALVLAASRGNNLYELTEDQPKAMLKVGGVPLIKRLVSELRRQAVKSITVIAGYKAEKLVNSDYELCINEQYETTGELVTLACAVEKYTDDMIITYGDLLFRGYIVRDLLESVGDIVVVVDSALHADAPISSPPDYAYCDRPDDRSLFMADVTLKHISEKQKLDIGEPAGRWIGMLKVNAVGRGWIEQAISELQQREDYSQLSIPDLLNYLVDDGKTVKVHYISGHWLDVNTIDDLDRAADFTYGQAGSRA